MIYCRVDIVNRKTNMLRQEYVMFNDSGKPETPEDVHSARLKLTKYDSCNTIQMNYDDWLKASGNVGYVI